MYMDVSLSLRPNKKRNCDTVRIATTLLIFLLKSLYFIRGWAFFINYDIFQQVELQGSRNPSHLLRWHSFLNLNKYPPTAHVCGRSFLRYVMLYSAVSRYSLGVLPVCFLKSLEKYCTSIMPQ